MEKKINPSLLNNMDRLYLVIIFWQGIEADFGRAYLSNVCVARELHRNGLGYDIVTKSKIVAEEWGNECIYLLF